MPAGRRRHPDRSAAPGYLEVALGLDRAAGARRRRRGARGRRRARRGPRAAAARHGARYVRTTTPRGLNAARNTGSRRTDARAARASSTTTSRLRPAGSTRCSRRRPRCPDDVACSPARSTRASRTIACACAAARARRSPSWTSAPHDRDGDHAWGANMTVRRSALERVGAFDERASSTATRRSGRRALQGAGGRIRYIAAAGSSTGARATTRACARCARPPTRRGRRAPLRRVQGHGAAAGARAARARRLPVAQRRGGACANGLVLARTRGAPARGAGRAGRRERRPRTSSRAPAARSAASAARRAPRRLARPARARRAGRACARAARASRRAGACSRGRRGARARHGPPHAPSCCAPPRRRRRHRAASGERGKFENLNALLAAHPPRPTTGCWSSTTTSCCRAASSTRFLFRPSAPACGSPSPRTACASHAAWPVTRRRPAPSCARRRFVEIGPVTAFHRDSFDVLLPFPGPADGLGARRPLGRAWRRERGWPIGIVDATPDRPHAAAGGAGYARDEAEAEARAFLDGRPYVRRDEVRTRRASALVRPGTARSRPRSPVARPAGRRPARRAPAPGRGLTAGEGVAVATSEPVAARRSRPARRLRARRSGGVVVAAARGAGRRRARHRPGRLRLVGPSGHRRLRRERTRIRSRRGAYLAAPRLPRRVRVAVVSEFYPRAEDPVLGVWAHRQAVAARDAGADVRVLVLHRPVPPRSTRCATRRRALRTPAAQPRHAALDGIESPTSRSSPRARPRTYGALGRVGGADPRRRAAQAAAGSPTTSSTPTTPSRRPTPCCGRASARRSSSRSTAATSLHRAAPPRGERAVRARAGHARLVLANSAGIERAARAARRRHTRVVRLGTDVPATPRAADLSPVVTVGHLVARKRHADVVRALWLLREPTPPCATWSSATGPSGRRSSAWPPSSASRPRRLPRPAAARAGAGRRAPGARVRAARASTRRSAWPTSRRWPPACR